MDCSAAPMRCQFSMQGRAGALLYVCFSTASAAKVDKAWLNELRARVYNDTPRIYNESDQVAVNVIDACYTKLSVKN